MSIKGIFMLKKTIYFLILFLLLPGNIYLVYYFFATNKLAKKLTAFNDGEYKAVRLEPEFLIMTHKNKGSNDFFCITPHKGMAMQFENDKFVQISAWHHNNHFSWFDGGSYRILSYEKKSIADYNKDFIPDVIVCHAKDQKFIIVNGKYLSVKKLSQMESAEIDDGHKFIWKNNQWLKQTE